MIGRDICKFIHLDMRVKRLTWRENLELERKKFYVLILKCINMKF